VCVTRTVTVAAGVFAPGHLGELTGQVPFELADDVLEVAGAAGQRLRDLPSRVVLDFVLALGLYPELGYQNVWAKLTAGLEGIMCPAPSAKGLRDGRRRIGTRPLRGLAHVLCGPAAPPSVPGVRFGRYRTVSFDGCKSVRVPDTSRNRSWLGKPKAANGETGYPMLMLMTLAETGTRALLGAIFGPAARGETWYARQLVHLLEEDMLLLADRGFDSSAFLEAVTAAGARFLVRLTSTRRLPVVARLPDGTFLSRIGNITVRVILADVTVRCADGRTWTARYRLATTMTDHRACPAVSLIRIYHERWEHEIAYLALKHTLMKGRVLRSHDPEGIKQEMWALLVLYQAVRRAMTDAVMTVPGTDPDRASFTVAVETARDTLAGAAGILPGPGDGAGMIGRAVLGALIPSRRPRVSARKVKSPLSRYHKPVQDRPKHSTRITGISASISSTDTTPAKPRKRPLQNAPAP
jgi:hypothetical protein